MSPRAHPPGSAHLTSPSLSSADGGWGVEHKQSLTLPQARVHAQGRSGPEASILIIYLPGPGPRTQSRTWSLPPEALYNTEQGVGGRMRRGSPEV